MAVSAYLELSEATEQRITPTDLLKAFEPLDRAGTFLRIADFTAALANRGNQLEEAAKFTSWALEQMIHSNISQHRFIAARLQARMRPGRTILHEKGLYLMQAMALLGGASAGREASDAELAILALAVNDYASDWYQSGTSLTEDERLLADLAHFARFNRNPDPVRELARSELIMHGTPQHPLLNSQEKWVDFQRQAFGCPYADRVDRFLGPLALTSKLWKTRTDDTPIINMKRWAAETTDGAGEGAAFLRALSISADAARRKLAETPGSGLKFPLFLYETPLVEFNDGIAICSSPWLLEHQLAFNFWARGLATMKRKGSGFAADDWFSTFGVLFEQYCRRLADDAGRAKHFPRKRWRFLISRLGGPDEIEDVVLVGEQGAILFSCKSRVMVGRNIRAAESREKVVQWLESFFFEEGNEDQRGGALRLLDEKVSRIRAAKYEPTLPKTLPIYPVIVTYDHIGESLYLTRWLRKRLGQERLLQQENVRGPLVLDIANFEILMSLVAKAIDPSWLLDLCLKGEAGAATFHHVVRRHVAAPHMERLPLFREAHEDLTRRMLGRFPSRRPI